MFALRSPLSKGVLLADEVGLGKAIEAALVPSQRWWQQQRNLLLVVPASLRKQSANELREKFSLPSIILDAKKVKGLAAAGQAAFRARFVTVNILAAETGQHPNLIRQRMTRSGLSEFKKDGIVFANLGLRRPVEG